jgi:hypothetical protein
LNKSHQKILLAQPLFFLVLKRVDDALDVLDSLLDGIQGILENLPSNIEGAWKRGQRGWT